MDIASAMPCNFVPVWRPCFMHVRPAVCLVVLLLSGDHVSCRSGQQCVLYYCCCLETILCVGRASSVSCISLETMLHVGHDSSMSCNIVAVWRPCSVWVRPAVCLVMLLLSGDHALCRSCQQCVLYCCCYLETMLRAGRASSMSYNVVAV